MTTETQLAVQQEPSVALMIQQAMDKGISPDGLEKLVGLYERMQDRQAASNFATAFAELQKDIALVKIEPTKSVPDKQGREKFRFAPYEGIMAKVQPLLTRHGFAISFDQKIDESRIVSVCTLTYGGHSKSNSFAVRIGSGPPGASECQADGAASTYAKRFALCNALNITIEKEALQSDATIVGAPMPEKQWKELESRVRNLDNVDEGKFLKHAGGASFAEIPALRYDDLDEMLTRKEIAAGVRDENGNWK